MNYLATKGKIAKLINKLDHKMQLTASCTNAEKLAVLYKEIEEIRSQLKLLKQEVLKSFLLDDI